MLSSDLPAANGRPLSSPDSNWCIRRRCYSFPEGALKPVGQLFRHIQQRGETTHTHVESTMQHQFDNFGFGELRFELIEIRVIDGKVIGGETLAKVDRQFFPGA